jgi:hypothetical protein
MVFYILLTIVFIAVFGWLTWRIVMRQVSAAPRPEAAYVCPVCNDDLCSCHKTDAAP